MKSETIWHAATGMLRHVKIATSAHKGRTLITLLMMLLTTMTAWADTETVSYIDENGETQTVTATVLTGSETAIYNGWYVVSSNITYTGTVTLTGNVNLILADGCTMNVGTSIVRINDYGIYGDNDYDLTIYGQSTGADMGKLSLYSKCFNNIRAKNITINGGNVTADNNGVGIVVLMANNDITINGGNVTVSANDDHSKGISADRDINIKGGTVTASGTECGIAADGGTITLGGGTVTASSYHTYTDKITISDGLTYYNGNGVNYTGSIDLTVDEIVASITNRTLRLFDYRSGTCGRTNANDGKDVTWLLNLETKTLTINGTGAMNDYGNNNQPWKDFISEDITTAVIGDGVTSISNYFLRDCTSLTSVIIGSSVAKIGSSAFKGCTSLTSIDIPASVTRIENSAFHSSTSLATVSGATGVTYIGSSVFSDTAWDNNLMNLYDGLICVGHVAYRYNGSDTSVTLPDGTTQICFSAFQGSAITSIVIPASVTRIESYAFESCNLEKAYSLATTPPYLGSNAFAGCHSYIIVVPVAVYNPYKNSWSSYSSNLRPGYKLTCDEGITTNTGSPIEAEGQEVTLGYTGNVPDGYKATYYVSAGTISGNVLTMPDVDINVRFKTLRSTGEAVSVSYIDENGEPQTHNAIALDGTESSLAAGWYFVGKDVTYSNGINITGNVNLILADNCQMNVGKSTERIDGIGIDGSSKRSLTITSESLGDDMGHLSVYTTGEMGYGIFASALTINGGNITADTDGNTAPALCSDDDLTINGGTVSATTTGNESDALYADEDFYYSGGKVTATATGTDANAIYAEEGNYTFSWRTPADRITIGATGLFTADDKTATFSKAFTDGTTVYSTTLTGSELNALSGVTLYPYEENLNLAANAHDGNYWTTFYCGHTGYKINDGENAWAYTATVSGNELTLHKLGKVIPKQTAVIIVGSDNSISMTASTAEAENTVSNDLQGEDVRTSTADIKTANSITDGTFYVMGKVNDVFGFFQYTAQYMPARKAYLLIDGDGDALANGLKMVFDDGETLGLSEMRNEKGEMRNGSAWYTLSGTRLNSQPTQPGLYIHGNKKVVIK